MSSEVGDCSKMLNWYSLVTLILIERRIFVAPWAGILEWGQSGISQGPKLEVRGKFDPAPHGVSKQFLMYFTGSSSVYFRSASKCSQASRGVDMKIESSGAGR